MIDDGVIFSVNKITIYSVYIVNPVCNAMFASTVVACYSPRVVDARIYRPSVSAIDHPKATFYH